MNAFTTNARKTWNRKMTVKTQIAIGQKLAAILDAAQAEEVDEVTTERFTVISNPNAKGSNGERQRRFPNRNAASPKTAPHRRTLLSGSGTA